MNTHGYHHFLNAGCGIGCKASLFKTGMLGERGLRSPTCEVVILKAAGV